MNSRLNLSIPQNLRSTLERIAKFENKSLTEVINMRLEASLTFIERFGELPEYLKSRSYEEGGLNKGLPEPLKKIQDAIDNLEKAKYILKELYADEVRSME